MEKMLCGMEWHYKGTKRGFGKGLLLAAMASGEKL
jgi:hypothetical protein